MADIRQSKIVPTSTRLPYLPTIGNDEVVMLASGNTNNTLFKYKHMCMNIMATTYSKYGGVVLATQIAEVGRIGIFSAWEWKKRLGQLCDDGYFLRTHVGIQEYITPELKFEKLVEKLGFEIIK